jgi:hypothetical protein
MRLHTAVTLLALWANVAHAQSLKVSADWLRDFVQAEGRVSNLNWRDLYRVLINDCHVTIFHDTEDLSCTRPENKSACGRGFGHMTTNHFKLEFDLKEIDLARIAVEEEPSFFSAYAIKLTTANERPLVVESVKLGGEFKKANEGHEAYVVLLTRDAAEGVAKAFRHAGSLCNAKTSPF